MNEARFFPRRLSFPKICDVLIAYLNAGADKEYVSVGEVVEKSNVTLHNISRNNNFLKSWGFVEEKTGETRKYKLSRNAAEFAYAYKIDPNSQQTREMLKKIFSRDEVLTKFVERIRSEKPARETVLVEFPRLFGDLRADEVGLNAFLDMIAYAFQLEEMTKKAKPIKMLKEGRKVFRQLREGSRASTQATITIPRASVSINLNISPEISPERLKEYIRAIIEALESKEQNGG